MTKYPFMCGNWKMFKTISEAKVFAEEFKKLYRGTDVRACICAPFPQLQTLVDAFEGTDIKVGAQNCHFEKEGAFTGEVSVPMLKDLGVDYCIVGHSERRQYFAESDESCNKKIKALFEYGILPILCVGEDLYQREHNYQDKLVAEQVVNALKGLDPELARKITIAYEPIWAIGTGKTASPEIAGKMCELIRDTLIDMYGDEIADDIIIQYGGSVKPDNITEIMEELEIDGALVGGASLKPDSFMEIIDF